jgi:hypothetical protein
MIYEAAGISLSAEAIERMIVNVELEWIFELGLCGPTAVLSQLRELDNIRNRPHTSATQFYTPTCLMVFIFGKHVIFLGDISYDMATRWPCESFFRF